MLARRWLDRTAPKVAICELVRYLLAAAVNNEFMDKLPLRKSPADISVANKSAQPLAEMATSPKQFFRASNRLFCLNGEWYFQASEDDHGPFTRREAAEQALERFTGERLSFEEAAEAIIRDCAQDLHATTAA